MARQARGRAPREEEHSTLTVTGVDGKGNPFQEETQTIDISESGVSFYLKTPIWMDSHLTLQIQSSSLFGAGSIMKAKVVRIQSGNPRGQLIGARFD